MLYNENPFKTLGVSPSDGRREIARQAEERALLWDSQKCADARTTLTNPQRRIAAEVHWFLDCSAEELKEIEAYISAVLNENDPDDFPWDNYCALTQLNVQLACLDAQSMANTTMAKYYVLGVSRLFEAVSAEDVLQLINENRRQAGFPEVSKSADIESALNEMRSEIRQLLSHRLQRLPEGHYIQVVTLLSESYSGNQRYKGNAVLEDVISEYQIYINDTLQKQGQTIIKTAGFIAMGVKKINVSQAVSDLIDRLYEWDKLAQPLQLGALTKGTAHEESEDILIALRDLALKLHNEHSMSAESLEITKATQNVFKELPEYIDLLSNDNKTLTRLIGEQDAEDDLLEGLKEIEILVEALKKVSPGERDGKITALLSKMVALDTLIKSSIGDIESRNQLREQLAYLVRSVGIELHNTKNDSERALRVITSVQNEFSNIPALAKVLDDDSVTLLKHVAYQRAVAEKKQQQDDVKKANRIIRFVFIAIVILAVAISSCASEPSSYSSTSYAPSTTTKTTPAPTAKPKATPTPQSLPANGKVFFCATTDRPSSFKVTNSGSSNYYMKFVKAGTDTKVITFFVRAGSAVEIDMPAGNLELRYAYGSTWYGESRLFGDDTMYAKDEEYYDFSNYSWEISLYTTTNVGQTMDVESIGANEF